MLCIHDIFMIIKENEVHITHFGYFKTYNDHKLRVFAMSYPLFTVTHSEAI